MADDKRVTLQFPVFEQSELTGTIGNYPLPKGMMVFITDSENNPKKIYMRVGDGTTTLSELSNLSDMAATSLTLTSLVVGDGTASGEKSVAEGVSTKATGKGSHAEGYNTEAKVNWTHTEGWETKAHGPHAHAEGSTTRAYGESSHAEGWNTQAGNYSISNGETTYSGEGAHAEGFETYAKGDASHAGGRGTIASANYQTVIGTYNVQDDDALFIVGNGTSNTSRSNALVVKTNGDVYINGNKIN